MTSMSIVSFKDFNDLRSFFHSFEALTYSEILASESSLTAGTLEISSLNLEKSFRALFIFRETTSLSLLHFSGSGDLFSSKIFALTLDSLLRTLFSVSSNNVLT